MRLVVVTILLGLAATATAEPPNEQRDALTAARQVAAWLESVRIETPSGVAWPVDPRDPATVSHDLYHGTPGVILFLLELSRITGDPRTLEDVRGGIADLLTWLDEHGTDAECGLWTGLAGQGWVLQAVAERTGDERCRDGARRCVRLLTDRAETVGDGVRWNDMTDLIAGSAGIGLFLLRVADRLDDAESLALAERAGRHLLDVAIEVPIDGEEPGRKWFMSPGYERLMPNLSHGTAGVSLFLASLHERLVTRDGSAVDPRFLDGARAGARYLQSIAETTDDGCRIFHHEPGGEELYYLGWCHGPVGTGQLFTRLAVVTGEEGYRRWERRCARVVMASGIPERRTAGFWNNVGRCCGSAGIASFFLSRVARLGDERGVDDLAFARRMIDDLLGRATTVRLTDGRTGLMWVQAEHRVRPELLVAQTGYMQGAAGIGLMLLELDDLERDGRPRFWLPDTADAFGLR